MLRQQPLCSAEWCPSHGKQENWKPSITNLGNAEQWKKYNDFADVAAKTGAKKQATRMGWKRYNKAWLDAESSARQALRRLQLAVVRYAAADPPLAEYMDEWYLARPFAQSY